MSGGKPVNLRALPRLGVVIAAVSAATLVAAIPASGGDMALRTPIKAPTNPSFDWTGFYVGGHVGYATGYSNWSATEAGALAPSLSGSLDFFKAYDGFKGTGSYFAGLQAGYSYMLPSRLVVGLEADVSFPNLIGG